MASSSSQSDYKLKSSECKIKEDAQQKKEEICHLVESASSINIDKGYVSEQKSATELNSASHLQTMKENDSPEKLGHLPYLYSYEDCNISLPKLEPEKNHFIMFSPCIHPGQAPHPYPDAYTDKWDCDHVRMPCSPENKYSIEIKTIKQQMASRWELICQSLSAGIQSSFELEEAIMRYNSEYKGRWNFMGLHAFFNTHLKEAERVHFFEKTLPQMAKMALDLPNICTQPIPLLKKNQDRSLTLSQKQIGCLLMNAFFCTFPQRYFLNSRSKSARNSEYSEFPDINFTRLFLGTKNSISNRNVEKLKCLLNYFRRITSKEPSGTVTFHRQYLQDFPTWHESSKGIRAAVIKSDGFIESDAHGMLHVDFADEYIGGIVLGQGCVQEEIRFVMCPELIVSRLFVERMGNSEVVIMTGVEQYNKYSGYFNTFKWEGDFQDETPRDAWGRRITQLVAMDALRFKNVPDQFCLENIKRELNKAYCGFYENASSANLPSVATGNWGCGVFKGNPYLKFLIQLMAASEAGRSILYFTFGDRDLEINLRKMHEFLKDKNISVGDLWRILMTYCENVKVGHNEIYPALYDFIYSNL